MATRQKPTGPSIDGLLGKISEKRDTLPRTPVQTVQPVMETQEETAVLVNPVKTCLLYTSPSPRDGLLSRMPSSA